MRLPLLLFLLCSTAGTASAQEINTPTESLYIELLGNTGAYSFNFDVAFPSGLGFRLGFLSASETKFSERRDYYGEQVGFSFVMMLHVLRGVGSHHFEAGAGLVAGTWRHPASTPSEHSPALTATLGYRYQPPARGLILRAGFTPAWAGEEIRPMTGMSIGYAFGALFR